MGIEGRANLFIKTKKHSAQNIRNYEDYLYVLIRVACFIPCSMACFYVIYNYVFSKWRSIRPVEINQYDIKMATYYDITIGNDVARDANCEIIVGNDVARDIHCDVTMSNDVTMCTSRGITMHKDVAINLFYYVFSALCLIVLFYYG